MTEEREREGTYLGSVRSTQHHTTSPPLPISIPTLSKSLSSFSYLPNSSPTEVVNLSLLLQLDRVLLYASR